MEGRSKGQRMKNLFVRCLAPCGCWPVGLSSKGSASKKGDADAQWVVTTKESVLWEDYQVDLDEGKGTNPVTPALSVDESLISTAYQSVAPNLLELDSHDSHHGLPAVLVASSPGIISGESVLCHEDSQKMQASSGELQSVDTGVSEAEQPSLHHQTEASASCLHTDQEEDHDSQETPVRNASCRPCGECRMDCAEAFRSRRQLARTAVKSARS